MKQAHYLTSGQNQKVWAAAGQLILTVTVTNSEQYTLVWRSLSTDSVLSGSLVQ